MRLYYLLEQSGERDWGPFEPEFDYMSAAEIKVKARLVHFDEEMAKWMMRLRPMWRQFGIDDIQGAKMAFHAFFAKFQVSSFNPKTALAEVVPRAQRAFAQTPPGSPPIVSGKVIIFGAVIIAGVLWFLFAKGAKEYSMKPQVPTWLMRYENRFWFADCIARTKKGKLYYKRCSGPFDPIMAIIPKIEVREGYYDRWVFMGCLPYKLKGLIFWHWYNWDFWDVSYIGNLIRRGRNIYKLTKDNGDRFAPKGLWRKPLKDQCTSWRVWQKQLKSFW